jgi:transposase
MSRHPISKAKQLKIAHLVESKNLNISKCAFNLNISRNTVKRYARFYTSVIHSKPGDALYNNKKIPLLKPEAHISEKAIDLQNFLFELVQQEPQRRSSAITAWNKYISVYTDGYKRSQFITIFNNWLKTHKHIVHKAWDVNFIPEEDLKVFRIWRNSLNRHRWELSVVITESYKSRPTAEIAEKIERSGNTVRDWINSYKKQGISGFEKKNHRTNPKILQLGEEKKTNIIKLIHESPKLHGINRTSWFLTDLAETYRKIYGINISTSTISQYLKLEGYTYRKAKEVLTSPDPQFRKKMNEITEILKNLRTREKFFSIDEFGPFAVKIKGGRSLVQKGEIKTFPQIQKSKGFTICTAALELSSNQITHFYSTKKNTIEMIKLIKLLLSQYNTEEKLYLSWDAASWHSSKELNTFLYAINQDDYRKEHHTPIVALAPLPASAQFLNVIESVFSGLAKSVIHNSNYESLEDCKEAISQYFTSRNQYFLLHPQKAGKKIWGKEIVPSVFKDSQNCKDPRFR